MMRRHGLDPGGCCPLSPRRPTATSITLIVSFGRHLRAANRSPGTIEKYLLAPRRFAPSAPPTTGVVRRCRSVRRRDRRRPRGPAFNVPFAQAGSRPRTIHAARTGVIRPSLPHEHAAASGNSAGECDRRDAAGR